MVMLHRQHRDPLLLAPLLRIGGGEIVRVLVTDQKSGFRIEETLKMGDLLLVMLQGLGVFQIADVLAEKSYVVNNLRQCENMMKFFK